ncbi:unnamed protein product, partial [Phaeothamnion confervicola]
MAASHTDLVRLILEFLSTESPEAARVLERDSGLTLVLYGPDIEFLRELILDGRWDDAVILIEVVLLFLLFQSEE